jgi:hypothetical protein
LSYKRKQQRSSINLNKTTEKQEMQFEDQKMEESKIRTRPERAAKVTTSGIFSETKMQERTIKEYQQPKHCPREKKPEEPVVIDPSDPYALIRIS